MYKHWHISIFFIWRVNFNWKSDQLIHWLYIFKCLSLICEIRSFNNFCDLFEQHWYNRWKIHDLISETYMQFFLQTILLLFMQCLLEWLSAMYSIFFLIVLTTIGSKCFGYQVLLPPCTPSKIFTYFIGMVDAICCNAVPLIEPCSPFHYFHLLKSLWKHALNFWKLEFVIYKPRKPHRPYLRRVKIWNAFDVSNKSHVWN